jgi:hypothetical protein
METQHALGRRRAAVLARAPIALVLLRGDRAELLSGRRLVPRDVETALLALLDELHGDVFVPLRRARTIEAAQHAISHVRAPFRALWGAIIPTLFAGLELGSTVAAAESLLRDGPRLPPELWTGRRAAGRLGAESLPFWAAAFDARAQAGLALARWPEELPLPSFAPEREAELIDRALDADLSIMFAVDALAERRSRHVAPDVSTWLAHGAHENARRVFVMIATPLYREADERGA